MDVSFSPSVKTDLNRYEQLIAGNDKLLFHFSSQLVETARLCRSHCPETDLNKKTIWNTATNVIAPLIFGFVSWVLIQAKQQGIQRLYFMARDGQILFKVAQAINSQWGYEIDCRYFYGSRQAFHFPTIESMGEQEFNWLLDNPGFLSIRIICERVNLKPELIDDTLSRYEFREDSWDKELNDSEITILKEVFQDPSVLVQILSTAKIFRDRAIGYFKQEGMGDNIPYATVDIGWSGKSQRSLSNLLAAGNIYPDTGLRGFFFGLLSSTQAFPKDQLMPYFLEVNDRSDRYFLCDPQILELFMAADHGSTVRYDKQGDRYIPILRSKSNESGIEWGLLVQHRAIVNFAEHLTKNLQSKECATSDFKQITEDLLKAFIRNPSNAEAESFGTQPFSRHQSESKFYDLAPRYGFKDTLKILSVSNYIHAFAWLPASIQRSHPLAKIALGYVDARQNSFTYSNYAWQELQKGNRDSSRKLAVKALKSSPIILLSRQFIRMGFLLLFDI